MAKNGKVGGNGGLLFSIDLESAGFLDSMTGINKAINLLGKQTKSIDKIFKSNGDELGRLQNTYKSMNEQLDAFSKKQAQLKKDLENSTPNTKKYEQTKVELNKVIGQMSELQGQIESNRKSYASLNTEGDKLRASLSANNKVFESQKDLLKASGDSIGAYLTDIKKLEQSNNTINEIRQTEIQKLSKLKEQYGANSNEVKAHIVELNNLKTQIAENNNTIEKNKIAIDDIKKSYANLNTTGDTLRKSFKATNDMLKSQVTELKNSGKFMESIHTEQNRLKIAIDETNKIRQTELEKLSRLKYAYGVNSDEVKEQITKINQLKREYSEYSSELKSTASNLDYLSQKQKIVNTPIGGALQSLKNNKSGLIEARNAMMSVGAVGTTMAVPGAMAIKESVNATVEWQNAFAEVRKNVDGLNEEGFAKLDKQIMALSKQVPETASSLSETMALAAQLGVPSDQLVGFTKVVSKLGVATNMTSEQAAEAMSRFSNITQLKLSEENFNKLGSTIVYLGAKMTASESEISNFMLRLGGVGNQVGMSQKNILALSSAMASVGISAEAGKLFCQNPMKIGV